MRDLDTAANGALTDSPLVVASAPVVCERDAASPSDANGRRDGWLCACGAGPHLTDAQRCARGHVVGENSLARQHGLFAREMPGDIREHVDRLTAGIVSDLGGDTELSTIERAYINRLGDVEVTLRLLAADIAARGLLTPSGGVRRVHESFLAAVDRWDRLAQRLGMHRRARRLADTFEAAIAAEPEAR